MAPGKLLYCKQSYSLLLQTSKSYSNFWQLLLRKLLPIWCLWMLEEIFEWEVLGKSWCLLSPCCDLGSSHWSLFKMSFVFPLDGLRVIIKLINGSWGFSRSISSRSNAQWIHSHSSKTDLVVMQRKGGSRGVCKFIN